MTPHDLPDHPTALKAALASAQQQLAACERRLTRITSAIDVGYWEWNVKSGEIYYSPSWKAMLGFADTELANTFDTWRQLLHPDDAHVIDEARALGRDLSTDYATEFRLRCKDGSYRWIFSRAKIVDKDPMGTPFLVAGTHVDITERKHNEAQLQEREMLWRSALEGSGDGLWDWNLVTDEVFFSTQWKKMLGFEEDEIQGSLQEWSNRVRPDQLDAVYHDIRAHLDGETALYRNEHQVRCKDGSYKWILDRGAVVAKDAQGRPLRMIGTHSDIDADRKRREQITRLTRQFTDMFRNHDAVMLLIEPESGAIVDANHSAARFYGYPLEMLTQMQISDINALGESALKAQRKASSSRRQNVFIFEHRLRSGEVRTVEVHSSPIQTDDGVRLFSIILDVTRAKQHERDLQHTLKQLSQAKKIAGLGIWEMDHRTGALAWSDEIFTLFELDKRTFTPTYKAFLNIIHPEDRQKVADAFEASIQERRSYQTTHRLIMHDGRIKHVLEQCDTELDSAGRPIRSLGTVYEITEIERQKERYAFLLNAAIDGLHVLDMNGDLVEASETFAQMLGYPPEELRTLNVDDWDCFLPSDNIRQGILDIIEHPTIFETKHRRKDGVVIDVQISAKGITFDGIPHLYASSRDITEQKQLARAVEEERHFIATIIDTANAVIAVIGPDGTMRRLNRYGQTFTGYTQEEVASEPYFWSRFLDDTVRDKVEAIIARARQGEVVSNFRNGWRAKTGEQRMFEWSNQLVRNDDGSMNYLFTIGIDIQEKMETEQKLLRRKEEFETIFNYAIDGVAILDDQSNFLAFNDSYLKLTGYTREELLKLSCIGMSVPEDRPRALKTVAEAFDKGFVTNFEKSCIRKDGSVVTVTMSIARMPDRERLLIISKDITQERQIRQEREALLKEQSSLLSLFDKGDSVLFKWKNDARWSVEYVSDNVSRLMGYSREAFMRGDVLYAACIPEDDRARVADEVARATTQGVSFFRHDPYHLITAAGQLRWVLDHTVTCRDDAGGITHFIGYVTDITEQKEKQLQIEKGERKFHTLFEESLDGLVILDIPTQKFIDFNQRALQMYGYDAVTFRELTPLDLEVMHDQTRIIKTQQNIVIRGWDKFTTRHRTKNGDILDVLVTARVLDLESSNVLFLTLHDVTEQKRNEAAMLEAKRMADRANAAKSEFLANMSHEIRTPLGGIIGLTDLVLATELTPLQSDYLRKMQQASHALLQVINDILDYSKIEAGKLEIVTSEFRLGELLQNVADLFGYIIHDKGLTFSFTVDPAVPDHLAGDPLRITQVLNNLVGNAVKFTAEGTICLDARIVEQDAQRITLRFAVKDSGIGISDARRARLFRPFEQGDSSMTRRYGGTGLGLMISKRLVEMMGGEIRVQSTLNEGSEFIFTVRLEALSETRPDLATLRGKTVLIVDDSPVDRRYLASVLDAWGARPESVESGARALEVLQHRTFDFLILDWKMPQMNGLELLEQLPAPSPKQILMITGHERIALMRQAQERGVLIRTVLEKPYTPGSLYDALLGQHTDDTAARHTRLCLATPKAALLAEDNPTNQTVASALLERYGFTVTIVEHGEAAVQMVKARAFDIVFMDLHMPVMDGYEATRTIRRFDTSTPIIALSAAVMQRDLDLTREAGMNRHLGKPIEIPALEALLKDYFDLRERTEDTPSAPAADDPVIPGVDFAAVREGLMLDTERIYRLYQGFYESFRDAEALHPLYTEDPERFGEYVHRLKGAAGNLKITPLFELCRAIEANDPSGSDINRLDQTLKATCDAIAAQILPRIAQPPSDISPDRERAQSLLLAMIEKLETMQYISGKEIQTLADTLRPFIQGTEAERIASLFQSQQDEVLLALLERIGTTLDQPNAQ